VLHWQMGSQVILRVLFYFNLEILDRSFAHQAPSSIQKQLQTVCEQFIKTGAAIRDLSFPKSLVF
jgi:hypothetical protein